ncbi:MAG: hypothetical protein IJ545_04735 [Alphaproteobacteria bacterium]|nr:hypothetical protein [Alphaproteobacteria bacterium]
MTDSKKEIAREFVKEQRAYENKRKPLEAVWQRLYELVDPANAFITRKYSATKIWNEELYSTVASRSLPKFVAAMQSTVTPPNERWHRLVAPLRSLQSQQDITSWLEGVTDTIYDLRYRPKAGFNRSIIKIYDGYGVIGLGAMFVDEDRDGDGMSYEAVNLKDFYASLYSDRITIKKCFRKIVKPAWEVFENLRDKGIDPKSVIPDELQKRCEKDKLRELNLLHVVYKMSNKEIDENAMSISTADGNKKIIKYRYKGYLILNDAKEPVILETQHFFSCPYMLTRYRPLDYDIYSNSPSLQAMPDIQMLQRMRKSVIEGAEKAVDPPLLARLDAAFGGLMPIAGAIMPGTLDNDGNELLKPLRTGDNVNLGVDLEELITKGIEDFYLVPLYMMYYQEGKMTATEINQRAMERAMLMSINVFPIENELLSPMVMRELDILERQNKIDFSTMPTALKELREKGDPYCSIQYEGEQHKAQELIKANGIATTMQAATALSAFEPHIALAFKPYQCVQTMARANGMPADHLLSEADYNDAKEKAQELEQEAAAMQPVNTGVADVAAGVSAGYSNRLANIT